MRGDTVSSHLTSCRLLVRNTLWNLLGQVLPVVVAVFAIPVLIQEIGVARFGVLTLAWIVVSYFGLFDIASGRALTKLVAEKLGMNEEHSIPALAWTCLLLMFLLGVAGGLLLVTLSPWLVFRVLKIPEALGTETLHAFYLLSVSIPIVTSTSGLRGILEAQQRFGMMNTIRIPMSAFSFAGPLLVLPFSHGLVALIGIVVVARLIGGVAHFIACLHAMPTLRHSFVLKPSVVVPVLGFGGWMTVSNLVSPIMVYLDRFLIGALLSTTAVAYYTAPFDIVTGLLVIPAAVVGVLFPAFALSFLQDPSRTGLLLSRGVKYIFLVIFPLILVIVTLAPEGLRLWLGATFARNGSSVLRWLAAGVFVNCLAQVPFALIQGLGRPDITAKLHLLELPIYLLALWLLVKEFGIYGAAIAWAGRAALDAALLFVLAHRLLSYKPRFLPKLRIAVTAGLLILYMATLPENLAMRALFLLLVLLAFGLATWSVFLAPEEKAFVLQGGADSPPQDTNPNSCASDTIKYTVRSP